MAVDWSVLGALRGRDNFDQLRADKQRDLSYQQVMNTMQEEDNRNQEQKQAAINQYLQTANNLQVLHPDMERIQAINEPLVQGIAENIKKYNGDLDKYWKVQGQVDMQQYLNQLMHHPTTAKGLMNASNASRWQADQQAGLQEHGEIDPTTGQLVKPFEGKLHDFLQGKTDELSYDGAFKPAKTDETIFSKLYGSTNPYKKVPVGVQDYADTKYRELRDAGLNDKAAKQQSSMMAGSYAAHLKSNGTPLLYKSDTWHPTAGWGTAHDQDEAMKYTVEGVSGAMKPAKDNPQFGWQVQTSAAPLPSSKVQGTVNSVFGTTTPVKTTIYTSDRLKGLQLGKGQIPVYEMNADKTGIAKDKQGNPIVLNQQQIDNQFQGFAQDDNGNVFYHTTVSDKLAELDPNKSAYLPFTDSSIDELVLTAPAAQRPKLASALRKALKSKGAYPTEEAPVFNTEKPESLPTATRQEWIDNGWSEEQIDQAKQSGKISVDGE